MFLQEKRDSRPEDLESGLQPQPAKAADAPPDESAPAPLAESGVAGHRDFPDGGVQAWLQVAGSFALYFNHLYGVFQNYYETELLAGTSASVISWVGSVQIFCFVAVAVITGPLYDMGYCRSLIIAGAAFETGGFMLTSISTKFWQILLAQGICVGLGMCFISMPSMAIVPLYFGKRRARAMATATIGSGLGAAVYPLIFQNLLAKVGFGWTIRVLGFITLAMCLFALFTLKPRPNPEKPAWQVKGFSWRWFIDLSAFKELTYGYALAHGMQGLTLFGYLLTIMNASSIVGRIVSSFVADKFGSLDTYVVVLTFGGASIFYWLSVVNIAGNVAFVVLWVFFSGGVVSLTNVVLTGITPDLSRLGTRLGMVSMIKGLGGLIGPPISGAVLDATGQYLGVQLIAACGMMLTAVVMLVLRLVVAGRLLK
ncbi:major facilitator superfamily domain-containing protein [Fusarium oxysporum Fo47]|uniref:major facilitator superfamily domain-containing protein n=1 Tax=Fusarium oxysporum Fo47 TaxID=660027 RepID=UPI0015996476|nr:major facilitator superfamily domain-containing protein [Fusarium oxysporum Fo47]QKD48704.1 major facilitator superfamily domain-containing protein [Fusarium oxysporum Fo47]